MEFYIMSSFKIIIYDTDINCRHEFFLVKEDNKSNVTLLSVSSHRLKKRKRLDKIKTKKICSEAPYVPIFTFFLHYCQEMMEETPEEIFGKFVFKG